MRDHGLRVYAQLTGLDEHSFERLVSGLDFDLAEFTQGEAELEFEGVYFDAEAFADQAAAALGQAGSGVMDLIDHGEWTFTRYRFKDGAWTCKTRKVDDSLDKYAFE